MTPDLREFLSQPGEMGISTELLRGFDHERVGQVDPESDRRYVSRDLESQSSFAAIAEHLHDMLREAFFDFPVPGHRLRNTRVLVAIPVMLGTVSNQHTAYAFDLLDQIHAFHDTISSSTLRIPGIRPLAMS